MSDPWPERIWTQLARIGDALEALVALQHRMLQLELEAQTPEPETTAGTETPAGCPHQEVAPLGMTPQGEPEWECLVCRYHHPPLETSTMA